MSCGYSFIANYFLFYSRINNKLIWSTSINRRSTFKKFNQDKKAWELIKKTGCDKFVVGDAFISDKHCNFFVNNGKAKSSDIEKLIKKVQKTVNDKTGINLELEIKIIGE